MSWQVVGIIIASNAEPLFDLLGFAACLTATSTRALKSVIQGRLLSDASERMDSMSLLGYMASILACLHACQLPCLLAQ